MARRERTTGLPRARARDGAASAPSRTAALERNSRWIILGGAFAFLLVIIGFFAYQIYDQQIGRPNTVVLNVDGAKVKLSYYADRLFPFVQANSGSGSGLALLEEDLFAELEREELAIILAKEKGIDLSNNAVLAFIAEGFGVKLGASGSSFDQLYRNQVRTLKVSDGTYRRMKRAELAQAKLTDLLKVELGDRGDQVTLRSIILTDKAKADELFAKIVAGENFGTLAQQESLDLQSRQQDGLMLPEALELIPEAMRDALQGKEVGALVGPIAVQNAFWIARIERQEPADYSEAQKTQLAGARLTAAIDQKRVQIATKIDRALDNAAVTWAEAHAD